MTTLTATAAPSRTGAAPRLTFAGQLRSEAIKIATLRSTWWSIGITVVLTLGIALLMAAVVSGDGIRPISIVLAPIQFTMLLAGIMGAIAVTGEYSTGMIRSTLTASPRRGPVLAAKALVVAVLLFLTALVTFVAAACAVNPLLAGKGLGLDWGDVTEVWLPILAAAFSMSVFALLGLGFGFVIRNGAGAIAATVGLLFVLPVVVSIFANAQGPWEWVGRIGDYLPMMASQSLMLPNEQWGIGAWPAFLTLCAWAAAALAGGWTVLRTRDA